MTKCRFESDLVYKSGQTCLDLAFLVDCTSSMKLYLERAIQVLFEIYLL